MKRIVKPLKLQLDRQTIRELRPEACEKIKGGGIGTSGRQSCQGCISD